MNHFSMVIPKANFSKTSKRAAFFELFGDQNPAVNPWPAAPLGEHLEAIEAGVNFNPVGENDPASDWRVLKVSAVSWSDFLAEESKPISPAESFSEKLIVQRGDLIMSRANTVELPICAFTFFSDTSPFHPFTTA